MLEYGQQINQGLFVYSKFPCSTSCPLVIQVKKEFIGNKAQVLLITILPLKM